MSRKMASFRLPDEQLKQLKELADRYNCSQADIIKVLIYCQYEFIVYDNFVKFAEMIKMVK